MNWIRKQIERLVDESRRRNRWISAGVVAAAVVALAVTAVLAQGATAQTTGDANPSKGRLTSATFSKVVSGGTTVISSGSKVESDSRMQFSLKFDFASTDFSATDNSVVYTLPDGIAADDVENGTIIGDSSHPTQDGKNLGSYSIKDGKVTLAFSNSQVPGLFNESITTTVTFQATVQNSSLTNEKTIEFPGVGSLIVEPTEPTLQVSKAASKVQKVDTWGTNQGDLADGDGNKNRHVEYTITVGTTKGTGSTVTITDAFAGGSNVAADYYDADSFKLMRYESADDATGTEVEDISNKLTTSTTKDGHATFTLASLDALNAGGRYVLTYKATVTETDHTADTVERNNVTAKTDNDRVSRDATATTRWGNSGDINISKTGQLLNEVVDANDPKKKRIQYRIKVWSNKGTVTRIQIGDTANDNGTNIDTSAWNNEASRNLFFDHDSFHLTKYPTTADADANTKGTNADNLLADNLSFGADGRKPSLGLSISDPLEAGECYILTYTATVSEIDDNAPDTRMNNQAVARIYPGGSEVHTNQANAGVEWHNEIQKSGTFNQDTGYIDWNITVNRNFGDACGIAINDTLPEGAELVSNVQVYTSDRSGGGKSQTPVKTIDLLNATNKSVATEGFDSDPSTYNSSTRALHVVLGSWASAKQPYTISFTTTAPGDGTVSNQAYEVLNGTKYGSQVISVGVNRQTQWGINKTVGKNASDNYDISTGTYTFTWNATVTFPDQDLSSNNDDGVVKLHDVFGEVTLADGSSSSDYNGLHYAVAKDLYAELTGSGNSSTTVTLSLHRDTDSNGTTRIYTLKNGVFTSGSDHDAITLSGVNVVPTLYDANGATIFKPESSDAHVKSFDLVLTCDSGKTINGQSLTVTGYHSILDARKLPASTKVQAANSLSSNQTSSSSAQSQSVTTMSNPMEKQVRTLDDRADNSDTGFAARDKFEADWKSTASGDYDLISGKQHAAQFRIALNTTSYADGAVVTITDTLPAGMVLATSTNNGTENVNHPVRLVYGTNVGQSNSHYETVTGGALNYTKSTQDGHQVITFTFDPSKTGKGKGQYYITYTASFVDDTAWINPATAHRTYTNTVSAQVGAVTYTDDATLTINRTVSPVQKSQNGELQNDRKGKYKIIINPGAVDLVADSDTVELTDELSGWNTGDNAGRMNPVLDLNSVHLYSYDNNASDGIGVEIPKASYSLKYETADGTGGYRRIRVTVPDSTALVIVYEYEFRATADGDWGSRTGGTGDFVTKVSNQATLAGRTSEKVEESIRRANSSATGGSRGLYIYKVDADNYANTLDGSEFDLYSAAASATAWTKIDRTSESTYTGGGTNGSGTFEPYIDDFAKNTGVNQHDTLYALVETKTPTGYKPTVRYLVWLNQSETEDDAWKALTGSTTGAAKVSQLDTKGQATGTAVSRSNVTFIPYNGGNLYIEDEQRGITVTKNWRTVEEQYLASNDSDLPDSIELQLRQSSDGGTTWTDYGDAVTVSKPSNASDPWQYTWARLPMSDGNGKAYTYKVEETISDAEASRWKAKYTGDNDGKGISSGNITITNTRQYGLPQTGGIPLAAVLGVGTALVAGAAIILAIRRVAR